MKFRMTAGWPLILISFLCSMACNSDKGNDSDNPPLTTARSEATVTFTSGTVAQNGNTSIHVGNRISLNNIIRTEKNSSLVVQIDDSSVVRLMPESSMKITSPSPENRMLILEKGTILVKVLKLEPKGTFSITSDDVTAVVRGTSFRVMKSGHTTNVSVTDGKIAVFTSGNKDIEHAVIAEPGFTVQADRGKSKTELVLRRSTAAELKETRKIDAVTVLPEKDLSDPKKVNKAGSIIEKEDLRIDTENSFESSVEEKRSMMIRHQSASLEELKHTFNRIDEVTLYSRRVIAGIIISRGMNYEMITPDGHVI
ncbi:MAG TPA: FecR family protein, partial [Spirochaetota bacterium]|nr:FecR family protein [Spirochaetota bacterium]